MFVCLFLFTNLHSLVCERVLRAVKRSAVTLVEVSTFNTASGTSSYGTREKNSFPAVFERYCELSALTVEERKFCYDTNPMKKELFRLLDMGANEIRICKKIFKVNSDCCKVHSKDQVRSAAVKAKQSRSIGIIYE